jgi:NADPH:quinone reductase-like Zn-dependent oxidoreductase
VREPRNRVLQVRRFGGPDGLEVVDAPLPTAGQGEVRVRVLASGLEYTDVLIRRHLYPQTMRLRPPFAMGSMTSSAKSISSAMACAAFNLATAWPI